MITLNTILLFFFLINQALSSGPLVGTITGAISSASQSFTWVINPTVAASSIQLIFESVNVQVAELRVADTSKQSSGIYLWNCAQCGQLTPPPIYSTTASVTITMVGVGGVIFSPSSFVLRYVAYPVDFVNIPSNISVNFNMGYAQLQPIRSTGRIPGNAQQVWRINQPNKAVITLMFSRFSLSDTCSDSVEIYDDLVQSRAKLLFSGCRSAMVQKWIYSYTGMALVIFKTGPFTSTSNFMLTYFVNVPLFHCGSFVDPNVLTGPSMIFADGSGTSNLMRRGETCNWNITPVATGTVNLILTQVSLMFGSSVVVYDSDSVSSRILWNGNGMTTTIPPIITSSGKSLFIAYSTSTSNPVIYRGFYGEYFNNFIGSLGSGKQNSSLLMSSLIDLTPPGDGSAYTLDVNYSWVIQPATVFGTISFTFSEIKLSNPGDSLVLYDGTVPNSNNILGTFSGLSMAPTQWFETSGSSALLVYKSALFLNSSSSRGNFKLSYYSDGPNYHCGFIRDPAVLTMKSFTITDGSQSVESAYSNQHCQWIIRPQNSRAIHLFFNRFSLFNAELQIYIGETFSSKNLFTVISQTSAIPAPIYIPSSTIGIIYLSKSNTVGYGFSMTYYGIQDETISNLPSNFASLSNEIKSYYQINSFPGNNIVTYGNSIAYSLKLSEMTNNKLIQSNLTWKFSPLNSKGKIYFAITKLFISDCSAGQLNVYDSNLVVSSTSYPSVNELLFSFCQDNNNFQSIMSPYKWISTISNNALIEFIVANSSINGINNNSNQNQDNEFEISYYSDGTNYHCGFINNPMKLTAPSMIFTDGSSTIQAMVGGQNCQWLIEPELYPSYDNSSMLSHRITTFITVIEFISCDLQGGELFIYAKNPLSNLQNLSDTSQDTLIWSCIGCSYAPRPIILHSVQDIYIKFSTTSATSTGFGDGFLAFYWTTTEEDWRATNPMTSIRDNSIVLEMPDSLVLDNSINNYTTAFHLRAKANATELSFFPVNNLQSTETFENTKIMDGRSSKSSEFQSLSTIPLSCGRINTFPETSRSFYDEDAILSGRSFAYRLTQSYANYLVSAIDNKEKRQFTGSYSAPSPILPPNGKNSSNDDENNHQYFQMQEVCKYWIENPANDHVDINAHNLKQAVRVTINTLSLTQNGRIRIFSGLNGDEFLFYDSNRRNDYSSQIILPCGKGIVLIESMASNKSITGIIDYGIGLSYQVIDTDSGAMCQSYYETLFPPPKEVDPNQPYYIATGVIGAVGLACLCAYYATKIKKRRGYVFYPKNYDLKPKKRYISVTPSNPVYNERYNRFLHMFLPHGHCLICKSENVKVFKLKCSHTVCLEDTKGYLLSALGDISMFPIKCPMHFEGCTGTIDANIARQILTLSQYERFIEFSDRSLYGDGMRCIFCANYVVYPNNMGNLSQVQCPYCIQYFCIRCKKPWHYNKKCIMDLIDNSLEIWKKKSGAQPCPSCHKLIEKDDPETCNHMVHKITDSIPCVRERTDFCYLCGEEVTPDYPHEEVRNIGVNHFPEGVFQKCRKILQKERDAERELLRKQKRRRNPINQFVNNPRNSNIVIPADSDDFFVADEFDMEENQLTNLWEDVRTNTAASTPFETPNGTNTRGPPSIMVPPSTPQVIHFPVMEDEELVIPHPNGTVLNTGSTRALLQSRGRGTPNNTPVTNPNNINNYNNLNGTTGNANGNNGVVMAGPFSAPVTPIGTPNQQNRRQMINSNSNNNSPAPMLQSPVGQQQTRFNVNNPNSLPVSIANSPVQPANIAAHQDNRLGLSVYDEEWGSFLANDGISLSPGNLQFPGSTPPASTFNSPGRLTQSERLPRRPLNSITNNNSNSNNNSPARTRPIPNSRPRATNSSTSSPTVPATGANQPQQAVNSPGPVTVPMTNPGAIPAGVGTGAGQFNPHRERFLIRNQLNSRTAPNSPEVRSRHRLNSSNN